MKKVVSVSLGSSKGNKVHDVEILGEEFHINRLQLVSVRSQSLPLRDAPGWTLERMVRLRRRCPELGWGAWTVLDGGDPAVFALAAEWHGGVVVTVHNLAGEPREASVDLSRWAGAPRLDLLDHGAEPPVGREPQRLTLEPYGYRWWRLGEDDATYPRESER